MQTLQLFLHLDTYLNEWVTLMGPWFYILLFLVIFCETGLVLTPFLPGDSLLFATGTLCAMEATPLNLVLVAVVLMMAAILGDGLNYWVGRRLGDKIFRSQTSCWFHKKHLENTQLFYERHGGKTIILARFLPIIRTFAPFVAGIGKMNYRQFFLFNISGGVFWVLFFLCLGFYFGNIPVVKQNFEVVILSIILISCLPVFLRFLKGRRRLQ